MQLESTESTQKLRCPAMSGAVDIEAVVKGFIRKHYGVRHGRKLAAAAAGSCPRTADNWIAERTVPRLTEALQLMAANEELEADLLSLIKEIRCLAR